MAVLALSIACFAVYLWGAAPSIMVGDGAELQAVALQGGIAHPSGYPLFVMAGQAFRHAVGGDLAHRITVMCALFGAVAVGVYALLLRQTGLSLAYCLLGAIWYGTSFTLWWASIRTEVYSLAYLCFALSLWRTLAYLRRPRAWDAALAAFLMGLAMTAHLAFGPAVLVMGSALALRRPARAPTLRHLAMLSLGFFAGLSAYLYLIWADARALPMNYLSYTVNLDTGQSGLTRANFATPWERIPWLVLCKQSPKLPFLGQFRMLARNLLEAGANTFLFEFGPVALIPFLAGVRSYARERSAAAALLLAVAASTVAFAVVSSHGRTLMVYLMACTAVLGVVIARGVPAVVDGLRRRVRLPGWLQIAVGSAALAAALLLPHALRVAAHAAPIGPLHWQVREEGPPRVESLVPQLRDYREPREYGTRAMTALPRNALVVTAWDEGMVLYYLRYVEGLRPDLALDSWYPEHRVRLLRWQAIYRADERPIVLTRPPLTMLSAPVPADSLAVTPGAWLYILRGPVPPAAPRSASAASR